MRKLLIATAAAALLIASYSASYLFTKNDTDSGSLKEASAVAFEEYKDEILVKEFDGRIGLFSDGGITPYKILDVYVFTLPDADKTMLYEGFSVSLSDVTGVVEDYTA